MTAAVEATHLTKRFGEVDALDDVTLTIERDTITGLLGRNGAGKTVLMSLITAHEVPTQGSVRVLGENPRENARVLGQTCFIRDNQRYPGEFRLGHVLANGARFYRAWDADLAHDLARTFELPRKGEIRKWSRGQLSAIGILIGLASRAAITFFDEPYLGLDATSRMLYYDLLQRDHREHPRTIVVSTHLIDEIESLLSRVIVLDHGRVRENGDVDELRSRALRLTGPLDAIDRVTAGRSVLHRTALGTVGSVVVTNTPGLAIAAAASGLATEPASLHELVAVYGLHTSEASS
ncbi:MAG TPA: ABC transporter ATP-binding protein [Propionibacteriaceae bacterium]|nr:ABC transporter ATP-binding protein [Propionibacteriaceae bacterium]